MKIFFALFLLFPSVCFASSFDKFVEKANNQSVLSVISQSNSHISLRDKSNAVIDVDRKNYDAEISKVIAEEKTNNALKALFLGKELTEVGTIYAQKSLVHATNLSCIGAGGTCIFLASTSIVFWPNGVIAGMCGAAVYACDKISTSILADLDKKMEEAV